MVLCIVFFLYFYHIIATFLDLCVYLMTVSICPKNLDFFFIRIQSFPTTPFLFFSYTISLLTNIIYVWRSGGECVLLEKLYILFLRGFISLTRVVFAFCFLNVLLLSSVVLDLLILVFWQRKSPALVFYAELIIFFIILFIYFKNSHTFTFFF